MLGLPMQKKITTTLLFCLMTFINTKAVTASAADQQKSLKYDPEYTSVVEISSDETISIYNTGGALEVQARHGFSGNLRGAVDGKIDEIDAEDFTLGSFIKELKLNSAMDFENTGLIFSVGKMPTGAKLDTNSPRKVGGVMGFRLSIKPKQIPLIQNWLEKNNLKITRIDITRYDADSEERMEISDLRDADMTSYALYLLHMSEERHMLRPFFIRKKPDGDNPYGVTSNTLGVVYARQERYKPEYFALAHTSESPFLDLELLVLSAGIEVSPGIRSTLIYSRAEENFSDTQTETLDFSFSKKLKKSKRLTIKGNIGAKYEQESSSSENSDEQIFYIRIETKF